MKIVEYALALRNVIVHKTLLASTVIALTCAPSLGGERQFSGLWGRSGEKWQPQSRLPDFSYAGYHRGERPLPTRSGDLSVKDFGAVGDGRSDDTEPFKKAIEAGKGKVILIPAGHYKITDVLTIGASGTCLKGAGRRKSILFFPIPLNEVKPSSSATTGGRPTSSYSWSGGFIKVAGSLSKQELSTVTAEAKRGDRSLVVSAPERFKAGDEIRLAMNDTPANTLAQHLYAGDTGPTENLKGRMKESFLFRVEKVDADRKCIEFCRPLRTDVRREWRPRLYSAKSTVEEVGIEDLGFEFPNTPYKGHFTEAGYNALAMSGVRNCWARNLWIRNADSGIFTGGSNITLQNIQIDSQREVDAAGHATGHHGIILGGQDHLLKEFEFRTRFLHDVTVTAGCTGNVASSGRGVDLTLDHHRRCPHSNLFTHIDLGEGSRMFLSGGGAALGRHSAAHETFWCIRARRPQAWLAGWGPDLMNLVGVATDQPSVTEPEGKWFEAIEPDALYPRDLYQAQLDCRLDKLRRWKGTGQEQR